MFQPQSLERHRSPDLVRSVINLAPSGACNRQHLFFVTLSLHSAFVGQPAFFHPDREWASLSNIRAQHNGRRAGRAERDVGNNTGTQGVIAVFEPQGFCSPSAAHRQDDVGDASRGKDHERGGVKPETRARG